MKARAWDRMDTVSVEEPVPAVGETTTYGWFDGAVHVTGPVPLCVSRTCCGPVVNPNDGKTLATVAPNTSDVLSSAIVGSPDWAIEKVMPAIVTDAVRGPIDGFGLRLIETVPLPGPP